MRWQPPRLRGQSTEASRLELAGAAASSRDLGATANWGTYSGDYSSTRYSRLDQVDTTNVGRLAMQWAFQTGGALEATPLVLDGILYLAGESSTAYALDARTGREIWRYRRNLPDKLPLCCGQYSRGLAVLSEKVYLATLDAHLVALDAKTGSVLWDVEAADFRKGYSFTVAPLIVKDKVVVGIAGAEYGIRGFIDAYDAKTGRRAWRFHTIPGPGEPGSDTWEGDSWEKGGGSAWVTGSYDPEIDLIYWGVGNPAPALNGHDREGDNLYTNAVVALDSDTGELRWHYQFTPHDVHDWDAAQAIALLDVELDGAPRKLLAQANRNGFFYVLDRTNGAFLHAQPFAKVTWASEVRGDGRPVVLPGRDPSPEGTYVCPGLGGAANWHSPSFHPATGLVYVAVMELCNTFYSSPTPYREGLKYFGSASLDVPKERGRGAVRAIDPRTAKVVWEFDLHSPAYGSTLATAGGLVFAGSEEGSLIAFDARTGRLLWHVQLGGGAYGGPMTYAVDGKQYVAVAAGNDVFAFALPDREQPELAPAASQERSGDVLDAGG